MSRRIYIFDTTLRDGEQSPGASLNVKEKVEIGRQLARLNVDVIEAGFPVASPGDFEAVKRVAEEVHGPCIAALARAVEGDIVRAAEAIKAAARPRIHTFIATSDIHMKYKLKKDPQKVLEMAVEAVRLAKSYVDDVEFSAEDATRSDPEFLRKIFEEVIRAGAIVLNVPDTVGYATPPEFAGLIRYLKENVKGIDDVILSVHCHNDLGLAVANSLAAIENGADQVECTINGIGERAGNAALEEIVMALSTRRDYYKAETGITTEQIYRTSRMVSTFTGITVQVNKAIVGDNAFAHEAGIHQDGILKERTTYEIMTPESIGLARSRLVLGKHSGRHAFKKKLEELGYELKEEEINKAFEEFIALADKKKEVSDKDIEAIVEGHHVPAEDRFSLEYLNVVSGNKTIPTATVRLHKDGELIQEAACGDGPVDATYRAIDRITGEKTHLVDYSIRAATGGKDALGEVTVRIRDNGAIFTGRGVSTDIIEASAIAYLNAVNKMVASRREEKKPEQKEAGPAVSS
ncbi:MAG: 2-isopropylmalate synthase [Firmicutes bacterium]|nr:2-isopropylmalate synthase [Bacillota bacterium]